MTILPSESERRFLVDAVRALTVDPEKHSFSHLDILERLCAWADAAEGDIEGITKVERDELRRVATIERDNSSPETPLYKRARTTINLLNLIELVASEKAHAGPWALRQDVFDAEGNVTQSFWWCDDPMCEGFEETDKSQRQLFDVKADAERVRHCNGGVLVKVNR